MCCVVPPPTHSTDDDLPTLLYDANISLDSTDLDYSKSESVNSCENTQLVLPQYDGNVSVSSSCMESSLNCSTLSKVNEHCIPVVFGYRPTKVALDRGLPYWKRIRRDNKAIQGLSLPRISNYNMRSLIPKINNFAIDMEERESDISFLTEVWEKLENRKHQFKIEELLEIKGIQYKSTPRPGTKRGRRCYHCC